MTGFDQYGSTEVRIIKELERRIAALEQQVRARPGAPVLQASGPLFIPNSSPDVPVGGVRLYAAGGQLRIIQSDGNVVTIPAAHVANQDPLLTDVTAPGSYSATWGQRVRDDLVATRSKIFELQTAWRLSRLQASS